MGRSLDAYLIVGWEVDKYEVPNFDKYAYGFDFDGDGDFIKKVREVLSEYDGEQPWERTEPFHQYTLDYDCDEIWLGISVPLVNKGMTLPEFTTTLGYECGKYVASAKRLYELFMGEPPSDEPRVMCVPEEA